jgi:hypothetical protein
MSIRAPGDRWPTVSLGDDLVVAGVSAGLSGTAALVGAWIGAKATRRAFAEDFDRVTENEVMAWRLALHQECLQNINLNRELPGEGRWSFQTRVLRDCSSHARAFSPTVLQRVIWAVTANEQLEAVLYSIRDGGDPGLIAAALLKITEHRSRAFGEMMAIEQELRPQVRRSDER